MRFRGAIVLFTVVFFTSILIAGAFAATDAPTVSEPSDATTPDAVQNSIDPTIGVPPIDRSNVSPPTGAELLAVPVSSNLEGGDIAIAEKLRELIATALVHHIKNKADRSGVEAYYRDRGFAPLWIKDAAATARTKGAMDFLHGVDADALDPLDYLTPSFGNSTPEDLAKDELTLTNSVLTFARHARTGRVSFAQVSNAIWYELQFPNPTSVLDAMDQAEDIRAVLDSYNPQQSGYKALKVALANERGRDLKGGAPHRSNTIDTITANMERWRWLPRDLGDAYVMVNIPDFSLRVVDHNNSIWSTRIVVGKVGVTATPLLSETIKSITVNPTWNVPPSIIRNEYLPALQQDPDALARIGLRISRNSDGSLRVYQPPGDRNALGHIRFNFPNKFLVYQHDTPDKGLFARNQRAYSHGCMRVQNPEKYGEVLLRISQPEEAITADRIRRLFGSTERTINLKTPIPVHLTYQTAFVDDTGRLQIRPDLYGSDAKVLNLLHKTRRDVATPVARKINPNMRPTNSTFPRREDGLWGILLNGNY